MFTLPRILGIPAAVVTLVLLPPLVVQGLSSSQPATPVAPTAPLAALNLDVTGDSGGRGHPIFIPLLSKGSLSTPSTLVDATGLHDATVAAAPAASCANRPLHVTNAGTDESCLEVTGVDAGHTLTGPIPGGTLTLTRKNAFLGWPLIVLALGFVGALIVPFVAWLLRTEIAQSQLDKVVKANDGTITGLDEWVKDRQQDHISTPDLLNAVRAAVENVPRVRTSREALREALKNVDPLRSDYPYVQAARAEAEKTTVAADDVLEATGKPKTPPAADGWLGGLKKLITYRNLLQQFDQLIANELQEQCRAKPHQALLEAVANIESARTVEDVDPLREPVHKVEVAYNVEYDDPKCRAEHALPEHVEDMALTGAGRVRLEAGAGISVRVTKEAGRASDTARPNLDEVARLYGALQEPRLAPSKAAAEREETWSLVATLVAIAVMLGFAGVTVWQAAYVPKPAFAGFPDYFALFSASLGSSVVAAGVVAVIKYWNPKPASTPAAANPAGSGSKPAAS